MRNAFIDELVTRASKDERIALVVGDLGYSVVEPFADSFPERFINAGVAEQNMMGLAAGMASEGYHVFVYSIANFPTFRCAEQIRNDVDYHRLPVTIVTVGGGLAYGNLGYSHHAVQDYGLMRLMPNMLIAAPGDPMETRACMQYLLNNPQPSYLRLGKAGEPCFHSSIPDVSPGKWINVATGEGKKTLLTTGGVLALANEWKRNHSNLADYSIHSMPLWGMMAKASQPAKVNDWNEITIIEDHLRDGGFCSWMLESIVGSSGLADKLSSYALNSEVCGMVGKQDVLNAAGGLEYCNVKHKEA